MLGGVAINSLAAETLNAFQTDGLYGRLNMKGSIIKNACSISLDSVDQTVDFGKIPVSRFMQAGPEILSVPFKIRVNNCDQKEGSRLAVNALNRVSFAGAIPYWLNFMAILLLVIRICLEGKWQYLALAYGYGWINPVL